MVLPPSGPDHRSPERLITTGCYGMPRRPAAGRDEGWRRPERETDVQYVSTRGESGQLGFVDVTLAGLARDGGLFVPATWPRFDTQAIAGFAGRPYAEVAAEIVRPFVGGEIPE